MEGTHVEKAKPLCPESERHGPTEEVLWKSTLSASKI